VLKVQINNGKTTENDNNALHFCIVVRSGKKEEKEKNMKDRKKYCDEKCNDCPLMREKNARILSYIFNRIINEIDAGNENTVKHIIQDACPNLTCCHDCNIDDFCHFEGCQVMDDVEDQ